MKKLQFTCTVTCILTVIYKYEHFYNSSCKLHTSENLGLLEGGDQLRAGMVEQKVLSTDPVHTTESTKAGGPAGLERLRENMQAK